MRSTNLLVSTAIAVASWAAHAGDVALTPEIESALDELTAVSCRMAEARQLDTDDQMLQLQLMQQLGPFALGKDLTSDQQLELNQRVTAATRCVPRDAVASDDMTKEEFDAAACARSKAALSAMKEHENATVREEADLYAAFYDDAGGNDCAGESD